MEKSISVLKVMKSDQNAENSLLTQKYKKIESLVWDLAKTYQGDSRSVLSLLRFLEQLHREIREEIFLDALPENRRDLYQLLKEIEESGGWPYIERMKIRSVLVNLLEED